MSPADNVLSVAILDTGDSVEPSVVPGVRLGLQRIHNGLTKPVDRTKHYGVHRSEQGKVCMIVRLNISIPDLMWYLTNPPNVGWLLPMIGSLSEAMIVRSSEMSTMFSSSTQTDKIILVNMSTEQYFMEDFCSSRHTLLSLADTIKSQRSLADQLPYHW